MWKQSKCLPAGDWVKKMCVSVYACVQYFIIYMRLYTHMYVNLFSHKEGRPAIHSSMDEPGGCYANISTKYLLGSCFVVVYFFVVKIETVG